MPGAKYNDAYAKVRAIKSGPTQDQQLDLYALAKIAEGKDISTEPKPGMFDLKKKATHKRWQEWADKGTSQQDAEQKYVALAQELISKHS